MPRVTISEPGKTPQPYRFKLERKIIKIGRSSKSDIIIDSPSASTDHCTMERIDGGYILRDNDSTNGTKHEDTMMSIIDLFDGMEVFIGDIPMKFELSEEEIETISEEEFSTHQKKKLPPIKNKKDVEEEVEEDLDDEDIEEEEEDEQPKRRKAKASSHASRSHRQQPKVQKSATPMNGFLVFILMILAIIAGMTVRHYKETGNILPVLWMEGKSGNAPADPVVEKDPETEDEDVDEE